MTTHSYYFSVSNSAGGDRPYTASNAPVNGDQNQGTSSYASDPLEIRITTGASNGPEVLYKSDIQYFLDLIRIWLDAPNGLDYVIKTAGNTQGIP